MKTRYFTLIVLLALLGLTDCKKEEEEEIIETPRAPTGTFTDPRDGQVYNTIDIGTQVWFAENLNYETPNSHWYQYDSANGDLYGRLYNLDEALNACPTGWHLPSDGEWKTLEMFLGMNQEEADQRFLRGAPVGRRLKSTSGWQNNGNGTNSSGFNALPGGHSIQGSSLSFMLLNQNTYWYSSTEYPYSSESEVYSRFLYFNSDEVARGVPWNLPDFFIPYNLSVRCIKD